MQSPKVTCLYNAYRSNLVSSLIMSALAATNEAASLNCSIILISTLHILIILECLPKYYIRQFNYSDALMYRTPFQHCNRSFKNVPVSMLHSFLFPQHLSITKKQFEKFNYYYNANKITLVASSLVKSMAVISDEDNLAVSSIIVPRIPKIRNTNDVYDVGCICLSAVRDNTNNKICSYSLFKNLKHESKLKNDRTFQFYRKCQKSEKCDDHSLKEENLDLEQ